MRYISPAPHDAALIIYSKNGKNVLFHAHIPYPNSERPVFYSYAAALGDIRGGGSNRDGMLSCALGVLQLRPKALIQGEMAEELVKLYLTTPKKAKLPKASTVQAILAASAKRAIEVPPDPDEMNDRRAEAAESALYAFAQGMGELIDGKYKYTESNGEECDLTVQNLTDLMADFGHFCDRQGIDFADILRRAQYHYDEETDSKGTQKFTAADE